MLYSSAELYVHCKNSSIETKKGSDLCDLQASFDNLGVWLIPDLIKYKENKRLSTLPMA